MTREECIALLQQKGAQISDRLPRRSDFSQEEVVAIKAHLGPFPRALEAAGLKEARSDGFNEAKLQKRINAKRRKTQAKIMKKDEKL